MLDAAVAAGKIGPASRDRWAGVYARDPQRTTLLLAEMAPGIIPTETGPDLTLPCSRCGAAEYWSEVKVFDRAGPVVWRCGHCGARADTGFRPWRGTPVFVQVATLNRAAGWLTGAEIPLPQLGVIEVHCGPPAYYPDPPTPGEILASVGLADPWAADCG